jgi:hypothetical protein
MSPDVSLETVAHCSLLYTSEFNEPLGSDPEKSTMQLYPKVQKLFCNWPFAGNVRKKIKNNNMNEFKFFIILLKIETKNTNQS